MRRVIVQKFGGTSLANASGRERMAQRVRQAVDEGFSPVVVVSAMGRGGDPYATDTLLGLARETYADTSARELDLLISCGEVISSVLAANSLKGHGIQAVAVTGGQAGIITDEQFGNARIIRVVPDYLVYLLNQGLTPVVCGFQGVTEAGDVTTLGRGGSDTTAAALGGALRAEVVEIYTDVDGVKTADPRLVPEARTIEVTTYDELVQMASYGARVIHPRAVEIASQRNVPLRIKSTFDDRPGTLVTYSVESGANWSEIRVGKWVTAVAAADNLAQLIVTLPGEAAPLFRRFADGGISVDLINIYPGQVAVCIDDELADRALALLTDLGLEATVRRGCAKVTLVGSGMRGQPGVMAQVAEALARAKVEILQSADSHVTISCLIRGAELERAVRSLHEAFGLDR